MFDFLLDYDGDKRGHVGFSIKVEIRVENRKTNSFSLKRGLFQVFRGFLSSD